MQTQSPENITQKADKRAANFSKYEEQLLINLVEKYKNIIESKKSNAVTWKDKEKAWLKIECEFNNKNNDNTFRSAKHLKEKYNNLKKGTKKKFAIEKMNISKTGGGSYTPILVTDVDLTIKEMLGAQVSGLQNSYDSDSQVMMIDEPLETNCVNKPSSSVSISSDNDYMFEIEMDKQGNKKNEKVGESSVTNDWTTYCSKNLKEPVSKKLVVNNAGKTKETDKHSSKKRFEEVNNNVIMEKLNFIQLQKEKFVEEHKLKMEVLRLKKEIKEKRLDILRKM